MMINTTELEVTRGLISADPLLLDMNRMGGCLIGLTLARLLNRPLSIDDKPEIPALAQAHLGLSDSEFEGLYRVCAWPTDLRLRWHEIDIRREMLNHPQGHLATADEERAARSEIAALRLDRFIASHVSQG